jgi:hypothetical protein
MCKLVLGICSVHWFAVGSAIIAHHVHWTLVPRTIWAWVLPIHSTYGLSDDKVSVTCGKKFYLFFVQESQLGCLLPIHMKFQMASFSCTMLKLSLFFVFQVQVFHELGCFSYHIWHFKMTSLSCISQLAILLRKVVCLFCLSHWNLPNHEKIMYLLRKVVCLLRLFCSLVMLRSPKLQPPFPSHSWYYWKALMSRSTLRWSCNV